MDVIHTKLDRVIITIPPQHGKSTIVSQSFPAFALGLDPHHDIISVSAGRELAAEFGSEVRSIIKDPACRCVFPNLRLDPDKKAAGRWKTTEGGGYYAVGIGGAVYGRGATIALIDDPFGSWKDAQSDLKREQVFDWYTGTLYNRVRPGGAIIIIQHRMHESDLVGRLKERMEGDGDQFHLIELPAIDEDGESLWPERYDLDYLKRIEKNTSPLKWSSLYMQQPMPEEGTYFKREWFKFFDPATVKNVHKYTTSDFAVTSEEDNPESDYTEIATHGYNTERLYLGMEGWYGQKTSDVWVEAAIDQMKRHKPLCFFGETGVIRRAMEPWLKRRMRERNVGCRLEWINRPHDKPTMARGLQGLAAMGKVWIADTEYGRHLLRQLLNFPGGKLDDAVDMAALMGLAIDDAHPAVVTPPEPEPSEERDYTYVNDEDEVKTWRVA